MDKQIIEKYGGKLRLRVCGWHFKGDAVLLISHKGLTEGNALMLPPGGEVQLGETIKDALIREFREETGMKITVGDFMGIHEHINLPLHAIELFFEVFSEDIPVTGSDPELPDDNQIITKASFVTFSELQVMDKREIHAWLRNIESFDDLKKKHTH